jgi:cellulase/cellobiase CelA1
VRRYIEQQGDTMSGLIFPSCGTGNSSRLTIRFRMVFAALLLTIVAPGAFAQVTHVSNPYVGATVYVSPDYANEVNTAIAAETAGSTLANQMAVVKSYPTFVWLDRIAAIAGGSVNSGRLGLQGHIDAALAQQSGSTPVVVQLVIYDLPDRDCAALASNGELSIAGGDTPKGYTTPLTGTGIQEYENDYITPIYNILAQYSTNPNIRFVLVIEDDSLPNIVTNTGYSYSLANCIAANNGQSYPTYSQSGVYVEGIQYALNQFHSLPNAYNYLDIGHHGWLGWTEGASLAFPFYADVAEGTTAGFASIDGIITNTANYGPTKEPFMTATEEVGGNPVESATFYSYDPEIDEVDYAQEFLTGLTGAGFPSTIGFLIDTSRNGWGGTLRPTAASTSTDLNTFVNASKIDERDDMGQWCNQENQGIGVPPTVNPGYFANLNAYVWVKPPGESDGNYPGSVYNGVTSTTGDPNCNPTNTNALANGMVIDSIPNSPSAGTFWLAEFVQDVQNAYPPIPSTTAAGFTVTATSVSVEQGTSAAGSVTVSAVNGFNSAVGLTVSGLPTGVTAAFSPSSVTGSAGSTLTFTATNTATVGAVTVTVTGTSGSTIETATLTLTVTAEPNFTITASPSAVSLPSGSNPTSTITVTFVGGLTGSVSLSASGLPSGANANFAPSSFNASGTSVVNFNSQTTTPSGTYSVLITGTDGSITHSATITLTVPSATAAPAITLLNPTSGATGTSVTITGTNFGSTQGSSTVLFGTTAATVTSWSATSITVTVPSSLAAGAVSVTVNVGGVASNAVTFTVVAGCSTSSNTVGAGYWHTSGNQILDANGNQVRIAGINWYGFETTDYLAHGLWAQDYKTVLNTIHSFGYNVIRIPFSNEMVETNPVPTNYTTNANGVAANSALVGQTALQDLDTIISYAGSIGLRVILDNHRSEAGNSNEANGLWYTSTYPQSNWIADWQTMATRYSASQFTFNGNPTVIGFDLRNEPHLSGTSSTSGSCWTGDTATSGCPTSLTTQNWPVAAEAAGNAVLAINPGLLIFVEGNDCYDGTCGWQGGNLMGVATNPVALNVANHLVYSAHDYGPNLYQQSWFNSNTTPASLDAVWNQFWGYISANGTAPVWVGELGTDNTSTDIESSTAGSQGQWFESLISYLSTNSSINWTYWALNGEDTYGLLDSNYDATPPSSLKQSELASIQFPLGGSAATSTPSFTLSPSPSSLSIAQSASGTDTITVTDQCGFTGDVTLAASGLPSGVSASFGTNPTTGTSVVTFSASSSATVGTSTVTITGTSGSLSATTTVSLTVTAAATGSFTLKPSASTLSIGQNASGTDTITVTDVSPFAGSVTLAASGLPAGVTASFATNPATSTSVLTLKASSTATTGTGTVTITGTSGSLSATTTIKLTVQPAVRFSLSPSPATLTLTQGESTTSTVNITDIGGFNGSVTLAASGLPKGVTAAFGTNPATATSVVTFTATSTAATGIATVTITGTSGALTETSGIRLTVSAAPRFTITPTPATLTLIQSESATSTLKITDVGGFSGAVTLAASGMPSGVTATFATNPATSSSVLTFKATSTATTGTATITLTGTSGSLSATGGIRLIVKPFPRFTIAPSAAALNIVQTGSGTDTIKITDVGGFSSAVTLAASGLPSGVTATFGTNPATASSMLTLKASSAAKLGAATVTITGTSGSLTATTTLKLVVEAAPSFTLSPSPATLAVTQGKSTTSTVKVTGSDGFSGAVTLIASGLPTGVTATFATNPTTASSVLTLVASSTAKTGVASIKITGTSGSLTAVSGIQLTVNVAPRFTVAPSATTLSVTEGSSGTDTIKVTDIGGFSGAVTLAASGLPTGVTATFATNPATATSALTLAADSTAKTGAATITITGVSGSLTATTTIKLTVVAKAAAATQEQ